VDKALAMERSERYADAAEMHEAVLAATAQIPQALDRGTLFPTSGIRSRARANRSAASKELEGSASSAAALGTEATVHVTKAVRRSSKPPRNFTPSSQAPLAAARPERAATKRWLLVGVAIATALAVTVLVTIAMIEREPTDESGFIVVQAATPETAAGAPGAARGALPASTLPPAQETEQPTPEPRSKRTPSAKSRKAKSEPEDSMQLMAVDVAAAFSRQKSKVINCLDQHPEDMQDAPQLTVRVTVSDSGTATNVQLLPESISSKRVGGCVTQAVLSMSFPAQAQPTTFRIPLHWRRK
jgi:hypothetical protein